MISILQRELLKKYKPYLHKVEPNDYIINIIKRKYELYKKQNNDLYQSKKLDEKFNQINKINVKKGYRFIDNVYFEINFDNKTLLNTFIYFTQKLHYQKINENHYSKKEKEGIFPVNQLIIEFHNAKLNYNLDANKKLSNNLNSSTNNSNPNMQINNNDVSFHPKENIEKQILGYRNYLEDIKKNFENSYKDVVVKQKLNLMWIMDALFKNDFSNIMETTLNNNINNNIEMEKLINKCIKELNNIKYKEDEKIQLIKKLYSEIIRNEFQVERGKIVHVLMCDRKYKDLVKKILKLYKENNTQKSIKLFKELIKLLISLGGFDKRNANQIIKIIKNYLYYAEEINILEKEIDINYLANLDSQLDFEISQLKRIKNYLLKVNDELISYNTNFELNEMAEIKKNFETNVRIYINNSTDNNFKLALKEINLFIKGKDISLILESVKNICKDIESNFYVDESLNLVAFCWAIQNGHDYIANI